MLFKPPRSLSERDPKEYPLARVQAPESIRKFFFDVEGERALFQEADDAADTIIEVRLTKQGSSSSIRKTFYKANIKLIYTAQTPP